jgi:hypothetical protein
MAGRLDRLALHGLRIRKRTFPLQSTLALNGADTRVTAVAGHSRHKFSQALFQGFHF